MSKNGPDNFAFQKCLNSELKGNTQIPSHAINNRYDKAEINGNVISVGQTSNDSSRAWESMGSHCSVRLKEVTIPGFGVLSANLWHLEGILLPH